MCLVLVALATSDILAETLDRHALVTRHNIEWNDVAGQIPLGNGEFCFNADATGLQTFGGNSMAHWGWHSFPLPSGWTADRVPPTGTFQHGRNQGPDVFPKEAEEIRTWMFDNPHIFNLGRLPLPADRQGSDEEDITDLSRTLDLWAGVQTATYKLDGEPVRVETCVHPLLDAVAVRIESPLIARGDLQVVLDFPYPTLRNELWVGDFGAWTGTELKWRGEARTAPISGAWWMTPPTPPALSGRAAERLPARPTVRIASCSARWEPTGSNSPGRFPRRKIAATFQRLGDAWKRLLTIGAISGARAAQLISLAAGIRAGANWNGGSCYRNT